MEYLNNVTHAVYDLRYVFIVLAFLGMVGMLRHVISERDDARIEARRLYLANAELRSDNQRLRRLIGGQKRSAGKGARVVAGPVVPR